MIEVSFTVLDIKAVFSIAMEFRKTKIGSTLNTISQIMDISDIEDTIRGYFAERAVWKLFYNDELFSSKINSFSTPDIGLFDVKSMRDDAFFVNIKDCKVNPDRTLFVCKSESEGRCTIVGFIKLGKIPELHPEELTGKTQPIYKCFNHMLNDISSSPSDTLAFSRFKTFVFDAEMHKRDVNKINEEAKAKAIELALFESNKNSRLESLEKEVEELRLKLKRKRNKPLPQ